jgi:flagellar assembly factor FliW
MVEASVAEIVFADGMVGCPEWRRFRLSPDPDGGPVMLLQSLDEETVSLLVSSPAAIYPGYRPRLGSEDLVALDLADVASARLYCVLTVRQNPLTITANLLGPIVVNPATGAARQVVLAETNYPTRFPVVGGECVAKPAAAPSPVRRSSRQPIAGRR